MLRYNPKGPVLTVREVARLLNVHENTVRRWGARGIIQEYRIGPRGDRRFKYDDVACLLTHTESKNTGY